MSEAYRQLLDATIQHLDELKEQQVQFVCVAPETLAALAAPAQTPKSEPAASPRAAASPPAKAAPPTAAPAPTRVLSVIAEVSGPAMPAPPPRPTAPLSAVAKAQVMAELRTRALTCQKCPHLVKSRKNVVFGVGDIHSPILFVGEAPGGEEDEQGEPFVGKAGQLLTRIIQTMGFTRDTVYIANILKCRPDTPGQAAGNRKPTPEEMRTCFPYLLEQIDLIQPKVIVALGATAVEGLLGKTIGITKLRGNWQTFRGIPLMPTYHPAYLLRNPALSEKRKVWEDMLQVMEKLGLPLNDKQRNYFLRA